METLTRKEEIEEKRKSFELVLRGEVHGIVNGITYPEIAVQKILHEFDKALDPFIDNPNKKIV